MLEPEQVPSSQRTGALRVGAVDDPAERSADRFASDVTRGLGLGSMPVGRVARRSDTATGGRVDRPTERAIRSAGVGRPIDAGVAERVQPHTELDLSTVRVHTGPTAGRLARSLDARAFTLGRDVYFGEGEYAPRTTEGMRTLAHELGHVAQRSGRIHRLVGATLAANVREGEIGPAADMDALREWTGVADAFHKVHEIQQLAGSTDSSGNIVSMADAAKQAKSFGDQSAAQVGTGAADAFAQVAEMASGGLSIHQGRKHLKAGDSLSRNLGAQEIEGGALSILAGGTGMSDTIGNKFIPAGGADAIPGLDVFANYTSAVVKSKAAAEDSATAVRLAGQKKRAKRELDQSLPMGVRVARLDEFLAHVETLARRGETRTYDAGPGPAQDAGRRERIKHKARSAKAKVKTSGSSLAGKVRAGVYSIAEFKRGDHARFIDLAAGFAQQAGGAGGTGIDDLLAVVRADKAGFVRYVQSQGEHDLGYGSSHRRDFLGQVDAGTAAPDAADQERFAGSRKLHGVAAFGHKRKAETATVNAVEATGAVLDGTGTLTAGADFGATKATGKLVKAGAASYKGVKGLTKRGRRVHKLRTAKNEVGYGGKSNRGVAWGAKQFFGGDIAGSQSRVKKALSERDVREQYDTDVAAYRTQLDAWRQARDAHKADPTNPDPGPRPVRPAKPAFKNRKGVAAGLSDDVVDRAKLQLSTLLKRRFDDLLGCLGSPDPTVQHRAVKIAKVIAETNLAGGIARIDEQDLTDLGTLHRTDRTNPRYKTLRKALHGIFERQLSGVGG